MLIRGQLVDWIVTTLSENSEVTGVFLTGSMGRRDDDEFSDIDILATADPSSIEGVVAAWQNRLRSLGTDIIFENKLSFDDSIVLNYITANWLRFDVMFASSNSIDDRSKATVLPLYDPGNRISSLPDHRPMVAPSHELATRVITEFYRVLGLLPVALGRSDYAVGATGATLLRGMLIQLLLELTPCEERGGALHLKKVLSEDSYAVVTGIRECCTVR